MKMHRIYKIRHFRSNNDFLISSDIAFIVFVKLLWSGTKQTFQVDDTKMEL